MDPIDEPAAPVWDEPRAPHLPDWMTAVPAKSWLFVVLAVLVAAIHLSRMVGSSPDPASAVWFVVSVVPGAVWILLPAALFLRHPDAWARQRPMAKGLALLAAAELLQTAAQLITDGVGWETAPSPVLAPGYSIGFAGIIVRLFAIGYLWIGLRAARRQPDPAGTRGLLVLMTAAAMVAILIGAAGLALAGAVYVDALSVGANAFSAVLSALTLLAWVAVASVLIAGASAGETGHAAWRLAAWGVVVGSVIPGGLGWLLTGLGTLFGSLAVDTGPAVMLLYTGALVAGAALVLAAFALGLPEEDPDAATDAGR